MKQSQNPSCRVFFLIESAFQYLSTSVLRLAHPRLPFLINFDRLLFWRYHSLFGVTNSINTLPYNGVPGALSYEPLLLRPWGTGQYFWGGRLPVFMLIGWRATNNHVLFSWVKYSWADDKVKSKSYQREGQPRKTEN